MTPYDAWKLRSPDDDWHGPMCARCENRALDGYHLCWECDAALCEFEAMADFYQWEPVGLPGNR